MLQVVPLRSVADLKFLLAILVGARAEVECDPDKHPFTVKVTIPKHGLSKMYVFDKDWADNHWTKGILSFDIRSNKTTMISDLIGQVHEDIYGYSLNAERRALITPVDLTDNHCVREYNYCYWGLTEEEARKAIQ